MENLFKLIRFVLVVAEEFSWQIEVNGGPVGNVETDITRKHSTSKVETKPVKNWRMQNSNAGASYTRWNRFG
jgi:hypothetical protein